MSEIKVNKISPRSGTAVTLGDSGDKFTVPSGSNITINSGASITNDGTATGFDTDTNDKVKVSANDTTPGFLNGKLVAGTNISLTEGSDGGNETLTAALSGTITPSDNTVTLAKMAPGTDGNIISYDASGNPVAVATGSSGQVLTSAGAGAVPSFQAAPSGGMILLTSGDITSTTSSITISSTYINDTYEHYQLWIRGKDAGDGPQFFMRYKNNADDATIESGYAYRVGSIADNGSGTNSDNATAVLLSQDNMGNGVNEGFNMTLDFMSSRSALVPTSVHYSINLADTSGAFQANQGMGRLNDATVRNSGFILFYGNGGDFANGTNYEFYGMKK